MFRKTNLLVLVFTLVLSTTPQAQNLFNGCESVCFDSVTNRYYATSLRAGAVVEIDEYGSQSYFCTGLGNSFNNHVIGNTLYVSTGTSVVGIDIITKDTVMHVEVPATGNRDGLAPDSSGNLYVVDTDGKIYKINLSTHEVSLFVGFGLPGSVQDIHFDAAHNRLLAVSWNAMAPIQAIGLDDSLVVTLTGTDIGFFDGVTMDDEGYTYCSSYLGSDGVYRWDSTYTNPPELISSPHQGPAALDFNCRDGVLAIPNFNGDRVDFLSPYIIMDADTTWGWDSLDVAFTASPRLGPTADSWVWDFGDGDSAYVQSPSHTYYGTGTYSVTVQMTAGEEVRSYTRKHLVAVLADTLQGNHTESTMGSTVEFIVSATNTIPLYKFDIPIEFSGPLGLQYVSHSIEGCRTSNFENVSVLNYDPANSRMVIVVNANGAQALAPGSGPILKVVFEITAGNPEQTVNTIDVDGYLPFEPKFFGFIAEYEPRFVSGSVSLAGCCFGSTGNVQLEPDCDDSDQAVDVSDLTNMISHLFISYEPICCVDEADIAPIEAPDGAVDIGDLTILIDHLFISYVELPACP